MVLNNSIAGRVRARIERGDPDKLWTYADFDDLPTGAVAAALTRLVRTGTLGRARHGVYYRPRSSRFGTLTPDSHSVAVAVLKRRGIGCRPSGLPAYNALGLTTQISPVVVFAVDREVASLRTINGGRVKCRPVLSLQGMKAEERAVLDALRDLKSIPDTPPEIVIDRLVNLFRSGRLSFGRMVRFAKREPPRVRALVGTIGTMLGEKTEMFKPLRDSLNTTTTFKLGIGRSVPAAREWRIR